MSKKKLLLQHLEDKMTVFLQAQKTPAPATGWVRATRMALGMSMQQLGNKLGLTKQSVQDIERREKNGSITLKSLKETAHALDMELIYGFVPQDGSLNQLIERKARELAVQIVMRTSNTMKLEDQENSKARIEKAIKERTEALANEMPKILWD